MTKVFKPMRSGSPEFDKYPMQLPVYQSRKLDGIRFCVIGGKAVTKSGKPIPNDYIRTWIESQNLEAVDGEIISGPPNSETTYNTTFKAVMTHAGRPDFDLYVFDMCDSLTETATQRLARLFRVTANAPSAVKVVEQSLVTTKEEFEALYLQYLNEGYEGAMTKRPESLYKYGRPTAKDQGQLKHKLSADFEGEILECYEAMFNENEAFTNEVGETRRSTHAENKTGKGMVGGYLIRDVLTGTVFKVGPGKLTHSERIAEWQAALLDNTHRIGSYLKYKCMVYGEQTNGAARHGRWIGWRDVTDMNPDEVRAVNVI